MSPSRRRLVRRLLTAACGEERAQRLLRMPLADQGLGYDPFGCERESAMAAFLVLRNLYRFWFRVESFGTQNIPAGGRTILASNHSGLLPFDGAMVGVDCALKLPQPRLVRAVVDKSVFGLPGIGTLFLRCGQVPGTKRNFQELLREEQLVLVFPEGARGSCKPYRERYRLRPFNVGFVELAIAEGAPIVPMAVVGAEEQAPVLLGSERLGRRLGLPFLGVTPTFPLLGPLGLVPYPVRYSVYYGRPIDAANVPGVDPGAARALEPSAVACIAEHVRAAVQDLIDGGLVERGREPRSGRKARGEHADTPGSPAPPQAAAPPQAPTPPDALAPPETRPRPAAPAPGAR